MPEGTPHVSLSSLISFTYSNYRIQSKQNDSYYSSYDETNPD